MDNWKARIDDYLKRKEKREAEKARRRAKREYAREEAKYKAKLAAHQRRFFCHTCGEPSSGPYTYEVKVDENTACTDYMTMVDESRPSGLDKCSRCGHWTCFEHIYQGICQKCGRRLRKPR